jgi:phytoene synthase
MGLAGLMRALAFHRARGQCYLPVDVLARHGLTPAHVLAGRETPEMAAVLAAVRAHAQRRLNEARAGRREVPDAALPAFLPVGLVDGYLRALAKAGSSVLRQPPAVPQWRRQWTMLMDAWRDRF